MNLPSSYKIHNVFHVSLLTPVKDDRIPGRTLPLPEPITIIQKGDNNTLEVVEQHHIMECYVDSRWIIDAMGEWQFQFKVKWDGLDNLTWESRTRLNEDAAKTNQQYLQPGDDDFDMEEDFTKNIQRLPTTTIRWANERMP